MTYNETARLMLSDNYKERFKAEYWQVKIRYERLSNLLKKDANGELDFTLTCPKTLLVKQAEAMKLYLDCLIERFKYELGEEELND